jgi:ubiquinone/menaquinone biosynthesis C-methylase UbiE
MVGIVNWDQLWKTTLKSNHRSQLFDSEFWDNNAADSKDNDFRMTDLTRGQISRLQLDQNSTVLEIGAGTGRLAVPIAKQVKHFTAVEPSINRLNILKENAKKQNITNMSFVDKHWEKVTAGIEVEPHNVVFSSLALFMKDTESALKKIDFLTKKRAYIFLSASKFWDEDMQRIICGKINDLQIADYIFVYNILYDIGIIANVDTWSYTSEQCFSSLDEATAKFMKDYCLPPKKESALKEYLQGAIVSDGKGKYLLKREKKMAMISWAKSE